MTDPVNPEPEKPTEPQTDKPVIDMLREWGFDLPAFEARAKKSVEGARGDLSEVTGTLRQALTRTKETLVELQKARGPVASELKSGFEKAWDAIEESFARARQKMRETKETPTSTPANGDGDDPHI